MSLAIHHSVIDDVGYVHECAMLSLCFYIPGPSAMPLIMNQSKKTHKSLQNL